MHHAFSFLDKIRTVIGCAQRAFNRVAELAFNRFFIEAQFLPNECSGRGSEPMHVQFFLAVAHAPEGVRQGGVTHGPCNGTQSGEQVLSLATQCLDFPQDVDDLVRQWHQMIGCAAGFFIPLAAFHLGEGDAPFRFLEIDLRPLGKTDFLAPQKDMRGQLQGATGER